MNFEQAFALIVSDSVEGGYSNDSNDPGGKTKYGIIEAEARRHGYTGDMRDLSLEFARGIYKSNYWDACRCDELPEPLDLFVFDSAVNQGVGAAIKMLQRTLRVTVDGVLGPATIAAAKASNKESAPLFMAERALRYTGTGNFETFGRGWFKRLFVVALAAH